MSLVSNLLVIDRLDADHMGVNRTGCCWVGYDEAGNLISPKQPVIANQTWADVNISLTRSPQYPVGIIHNFELAG